MGTDETFYSGDLNNLAGSLYQATYSVRKASIEPILQGPSLGRKPDDDPGDNHQPPARGGPPTSSPSGSSSSHTTLSQQSGKRVYFQHNLDNKKNTMLQLLSNFKSSLKNSSSNANQINCLFTILLALTMTKPFICHNFPTMNNNQSPVVFPLRECSAYSASEESRKQAVKPFD